MEVSGQHDTLIKTPGIERWVVSRASLGDLEKKNLGQKEN
jgi:hypothetical protein